MMSLVLPQLLLLLMFLSRASSLRCDVTQNTDVACNPVCTDPLQPFCQGTYGGAFCQTTTVMRNTFYDSLCDCPINQTTQNFSAVEASFATCVSIPLLGWGCQVTAQCNIFADTSAGSWTRGICIRGVCAACDPAVLNETYTCPGGTPCPASSRPGQVMRCGADGFWIVSGTIQATLGSRTITTTTYHASSEAPLRSPRIPLLLLLLLLLSPMLSGWLVHLVL